MKKAVIITSIIEVDKSHDLTYSTFRSFFSDDQRFNQTIETCVSLQSCFDNQTVFYIVDASDNYEQYQDSFDFVSNLKFISVKKHLPHVLHLVRTHPNKSTCECTLMYAFFEKFKEELSQYDYFFKISGRYQVIPEHFDIKYFDTKNQFNFFFKHPHRWDWEPHWGYQMVDLRTQQGDNSLYQYSTIFYAWSFSVHDLVIGLLKEIAYLCSIYTHYDVETLLYFLTRPYSDNITHMPWLITGRSGIDSLLTFY